MLLLRSSVYFMPTSVCRFSSNSGALGLCQLLSPCMTPSFRMRGWRRGLVQIFSEFARGELEDFERIASGICWTLLALRSSRHI